MTDNEDNTSEDQTNATYNENKAIQHCINDHIGTEAGNEYK